MRLVRVCAQLCHARLWASAPCIVAAQLARRLACEHAAGDSAGVCQKPDQRRLDRLHPELGYSISNVMPACNPCSSTCSYAESMTWTEMNTIFQAMKANARWQPHVFG